MTERYLYIESILTFLTTPLIDIIFYYAKDEIEGRLLKYWKMGTGTCLTGDDTTLYISFHGHVTARSKSTFHVLSRYSGFKKISSLTNDETCLYIGDSNGIHILDKQTKQRYFYLNANIQSIYVDQDYFYFLSADLSTFPFRGNLFCSEKKDFVVKTSVFYDPLFTRMTGNPHGLYCCKNKRIYKLEKVTCRQCKDVQIQTFDAGNHGDEISSMVMDELHLYTTITGITAMYRLSDGVYLRKLNDTAHPRLPCWHQDLHLDLKEGKLYILVQERILVIE